MSYCIVCNGTGKVFAGYADEIDDDTGEPLEEWESCGNCGGSGFLKESHSVTYNRYHLFVFFIWCLNTLLAVGAFPIWSHVLMVGMTLSVEIPIDVQKILFIIVCGVPVSIIIYLIFSVAALIFLRRDKVRVALILVLVSMGVILLAVLPWIVYSALNPGLPYSLTF